MGPLVDRLLVDNDDANANDPRRWSHNRIVRDALAYPSMMTSGRARAVALVRLCKSVDILVDAGTWPDGYATPHMGSLLEGLNGLLSTGASDGLIPVVIHRWVRETAEQVGWDFDRQMLQSEVRDADQDRQ